MDIEQIFQSLQDGKISPSKAKKLLSLYSIEKIGNIAQIDTGRRNRKGIPEIILAERKELLDLKKIIKKTLTKNNEVLISRIKQKDYTKILEFAKKNKYKIKKGKNTTAVLVYKKNIKKIGGKVGIIAAGTSDIGVGEEARLVCESMNCDCLSSYDVGIAGLHRIFPVLKQFIDADVDVIIVVAGGAVTGVSGTGNIVRLIFQHTGPRGQSVISISSESTVRDVYNNSVVEHIFSGVVSIW